MSFRNQRMYSLQIQKTLDNIVQKGMGINKKNILDAEEIKYRNRPTEILSYDSFGFLDKYKDEKDLQK